MGRKPVIPHERAKRASVGIYCPYDERSNASRRVDPDRRYAPAG
jgi:hypothetical protein